MAIAPKMQDVDQDRFDELVIQRSAEVPVVVDFWADWCGPCKALGPVLEREVAARSGRVELAKVDVDRNRALAARFRVQGIPAVKAFREGRVAAEFTGALPPPQVARFLDSLLPSEADELASRAAQEGDEQGLRAALELDRGNVEAKRALGRLLVGRGDSAEALELLEPSGGDFVLDGLAARARLAGEAELAPAFAAWDAGDHAVALDALQEALATSNPERRDLVRRVMVAIFTELGADHPLSREHRRRLAAVLN